MPAPPPPASSGPSVGKVIGLFFAGLVALFFVFVAIGLVVGTDPEPIASVDAADVYAILDAPVDGTPDNWIVVVEPGTSPVVLEQTVEELLALPEARGRRINVDVYDSVDGLEGLINFFDAFNAEGPEADPSELLEAAGEFDQAFVEEHTVARLSWSVRSNQYYLCLGLTNGCGPENSIAVIGG